MRKAAPRAQHDPLKDRKSKITSAVRNTSTSTGLDRLGSTRLRSIKVVWGNRLERCLEKHADLHVFPCPKAGVPHIEAPPLAG